MLSLTALSLFASLEISESGSFRSPKTIAPVGHAAAHAGVYVTAFISRIPLATALSLSRFHIWLQKVHFTIVPRRQQIPQD